MTSVPLVSAVIPAFNAEAFLADAIESVLRQSYPRMECIVVNDGSTDGTGDIIERYGSDVIRIDTQRGGVSNARNEGIRKAGGEYVALLDADDVWLEDKTARQMELFAEDPELAMVYGSMWLVDETLRPIHFMPAPDVDDALRNTLLLNRSVIFMSQTSLVKRDVLGDDPFDSQLSTSADCDVACGIAAGFPIGMVKEPVALYRQHPAQMHRDLHALERDMLIVYERFFSRGDLAPEIRALRSRALASLYFTLAAGALHQHRYGLFLTSITRALVPIPSKKFKPTKALGRERGT